MNLDRFWYELRIMGRRVTLVPLLILLGTLLIAEYLHLLKIDPRSFLESGLEMLLPFGVGTVIGTLASSDPALELQLTLPRLYRNTALTRLFMIVGWASLVAFISTSLLFELNLQFLPTQIVSWSLPLQWLAQQLTWLAPLLWCSGFGLILALALRSRTAGGAFLCVIWLIEVSLHLIFASTSWLKAFYLFPITFSPDFHPWLLSRLLILGSGLLFSLIGWLLLRNPEGLLKGASTE